MMKIAPEFSPFQLFNLIKHVQSWIFVTVSYARWQFMMLLMKWGIEYENVEIMKRVKNQMLHILCLNLPIFFFYLIIIWLYSDDYLVQVPEITTPLIIISKHSTCVHRKMSTFLHSMHWFNLWHIAQM